MKLKNTLFAAGALAFSVGMASATTLNITVTNVTGTGGFSVTPLYVNIHDGSFDPFDNGGTASMALEEIAETGSPAGVRAERLAADPDSFGEGLASPSGPPPVQPGETVSTQVTIDANSALYFSFLAMLLPSNDTFLGNDDSFAYQLFDAAGNFTGDRTINVTGADIYDAGTEANALFGSAFVDGEVISEGGPGEGLITAGTDLSIFAGATLATGDTLGSGAILDFTSNPAAFGLLSISITEVAPIPLPASAPLLLGGLALLGWRARKSKR